MPSKPDIPNFEITTYCGSGAYGDVWIGKDRDGVTRAVKVLDIERLQSLGVLQREEKAVKLFRTQAQKHPHLIDIFFAGETDTYIYYVMELADNIAAEGEEYIPDSLSERLKDGKPLPLNKSLKVINQLLDAVEHLHKNGLLHRDIKPSNVLFLDRVAKLADIGLVSSSNSEVSLAGTPGFFPPGGETGPEADLYALGKLLYCMVTGKSTDDFPSLPDYSDNPEMLKQMKLINSVIITACDKDHVKRFHSVDEFRQALIGNLPARKINKRLVVEVILLIIVLTLSGNYWHKKYQDYKFRKEIEQQVLQDMAKKERAALMKEAENRFMQGSPSQAIKIYDQMKTKWPKWGSQDFEYRKARERVEVLLDRAREMGGEKNMEAYFNAVQTMINNPEEGLVMLEKIWEDPDARKGSAIISTYATALQKAGRKDKAGEVYAYLDKADLNKDSIAATYRTRAEFYLNRDENTKALLDFDVSVKNAPGNYVYYLLRSDAKGRLRDLKGAKQDAIKAKELAPDHPLVIKNYEALQNVPD